MFALNDEAGKEFLDQRLIWARRCRIPAFVDLARPITKHRESIGATLEYHPSNRLLESTNTTIRALTRKAFGSKSRRALIAVAKLNLGGYRQPLPGRQTAQQPTETAGEPGKCG